MPARFRLFRPRLVGDDRHPRFVIRDGRRIVDHYWTGSKWSRKLRDARLFHDPDDVTRTVARLTRRHLRRHEAKRLYLLTLIVRVHAVESVSRSHIERYLQHALVIGLDHKRFGTGPTPDSLVEIIPPPAINLEECC